MARIALSKMTPHVRSAQEEMVGKTLHVKRIRLSLYAVATLPLQILGLYLKDSGYGSKHAKVDE